MPTRLSGYHAGSIADNGHAIYSQDKTMYTMASPGILIKASPEVSSPQPCAAQVCPFSAFMASHEEFGLEVRRIERKLTFINFLHSVVYLRYFL